MSERRGVITAGTWVVDLNKTVAAWPVEDSENTYLSNDRQGGGSGCNMAIDLRRLDPSFPVETIGLVGDDNDGQFLRDECVKFGIAHSRLKLRKGAATPFSDCINSLASGLRTHIYFHGVADEMTPDDFSFEGVGARILHLGLPGAHAKMDAPWGADSSGWETVLKRARAAGLVTNLEMMSTTREKLRVLGRSCAPHLDLMIVNDYEIGAFADIETRDDKGAIPAKVEEALQAALRMGPIQLAIAHFPEGAMAATHDGGRFALGSVAMPREKIAGVNGAGDAFAAGALYGWHEGFASLDCLRLGNACAAASMREVSTTTGVATVSECLQLAERYGLRPPPA
jgi:sugar/nucleoside kinase (ribokinase family)